jgi:phosphate:Na+ symporter
MTMVISLFGGLGLFLYGMKMMGDGLQNATGEKLKGIFEKVTSNRVKGVLTGAIITAIIQSSSATTVMVVGFVNARLMNLFQAAAVIMGADIGTTITAQIVSLDIDKIVPIFIGVGALIVLFVKENKNKEIGNIILGFGILFLGMGLMKGAMAPLKDSETFKTLMITLGDNKFLGILTGLLMTAIIQSSSASIGILIALASAGAINLETAVPILLGCNIGTCVTALLSSIGTSKTAKKAAFIHLTIKIIGAVVFIPLSGVLVYVVSVILPNYFHIGNDSIPSQIANAHTLFNLMNVALQLPLLNLLIKFVNRIIPGEDEYEHYGTKYIDDRLLETPAIAVGQTAKELVRMAKKAEENLKISMQAFNTYDEKLVKKVYENEKLINLLEDEITMFLVKLSKTELAASQTDIVTSMFHVVNDIERIGDHAENIADLSSEKIQKKLQFSKNAAEELNDIFYYTLSSLDISVDSFSNNDIHKAEEVLKIEERIDRLEKELRASHIKRLNAGTCNATVGAIFLDIISNLERIGDHSMNIADYVINKYTF